MTVQIGQSALPDDLIAQARQKALADMRPLVVVLEELSALSPDDFCAALGALFAWPVKEVAQLLALTADFSRLSYPECVRAGVICAKDADGVMWLVISDPFDTHVESWARGRLAASYAIALAHKSHIAAWLQQQEMRLRALEDFDGHSVSAEGDDPTNEISLAGIAADGSHVVRLVNSTIYDALKMGASDIHLECEANGLVIQYRVDGVLVQVGQVAGAEHAEQVISRVKVMAEIDIAERRIPQDGRFKIRISGRDVDFRVSIMPSIFGEDAVLRLLDRQSLTEAASTLTLDSLGLDEAAKSVIRRLSQKPYGMLLMTGPTGSGKTTTLYAAITEIHTGRDKIITIEDPVEYRLPRTLQIPVNEKKGLTFARGLRSILRHDPDKIMVGEIRDDETAQIAVQAALTGHMVFTTVHANNVFDVVGRFLHMGVDPYSLAAALNGIVAQRLLRLTCTSCATTSVPTNDELNAAGLTREDVDGWDFRSGVGCGHCRGTGYKGRRAVAEVLIMDDVLRELVATRAPVSRMRQAAEGTGIRALRQVAFDLVRHGETTLAEVLRVAG